MKLSVLLLLYQLFGVNQTMRYLIYLGIGFQALFYLAVTIFYSVTRAECVSIANSMNFVCSHQWPLAETQSVVNVLTDVYVLVLPLAKVMQLQFSSRRRTGIVAIFLTGLL